MEIKYNATCIVTGKKDNLRMHAHRNDRGDMVGWVFLHDSVSDLELDLEVKFCGSGTIKAGEKEIIQTVN